MIYHVVLDMTEKIRGKYEVIQCFVVAVIYLVLVSNPCTMTFVQEHDVFTNAKHGVHVVGVDDRGYSVFMGDVAKKFVNQY